MAKSCNMDRRARLRPHRRMRIVMRSLRELERKNGEASPTPIARN
jgi:hypothetical protein